MATIQHDGHDTDVRLSNCVLHMDGEFSGNLDFEVTFNRDVDIDVVRSNLRLRDEHGRDMIVDVVGFTGNDDQYDITTKWPVDPSPKAIEFSWRTGGVDLGSVPVREVRVSDWDDSERFEQTKTGGCSSALLFGLVGLGPFILFALDKI